MAKAKRNNLIIAGAAATVLAAGVALIYTAFCDNLVFFYSPTEVVAGKAPENAVFRVGGFVEKGSIVRDEKTLEVQFVISDTDKRLKARYRGVLPDLFKEGKGVVAQGRLGKDKVFEANEVLAKHDENYMPPEAQAAVNAAHQKRDAQRRRPL